MQACRKDTIHYNYASEVRVPKRVKKVDRKRQSNGIYTQASFGAEVESWWHREGSIASTGAEGKRIS